MSEFPALWSICEGRNFDCHTCRVPFSHKLQVSLEVLADSRRVSCVRFELVLHNTDHKDWQSEPSHEKRITSTFDWLEFITDVGSGVGLQSLQAAFVPDEHFARV